MRHHVYALIDPRNCQPFYVGKGVAARRFHHFKTAPMDARKNPDKVNTFKAIEDAGLNVQAVVLSWHETQEEAYAAEKEMIAIIGLDNLTNQNVGGAGKMVKTDNKPKQALTSKQERFCRNVASETFPTISAAYEDAYDTKGCTKKSIYEMASTAMQDIKIISRVEELRKPVLDELRMELKITKETLLAGFEDAKNIAKETDQASAMTGALREQGKLLDLYPAEKRMNQNLNTTILEMTPTERAARIAALLQKEADGA